MKAPLAGMFFRLEQCCANAAVPVLNSSRKMLCHVAFKIELKASLCHPAYMLSYRQFLSPNLPCSLLPPHLAGEMQHALRLGDVCGMDSYSLLSQWEH